MCCVVEVYSIKAIQLNDRDCELTIGTESKHGARATAEETVGFVGKKKGNGDGRQEGRKEVDSGRK